ncbi:hypothetical protein M440DRAFT_109820 [Trichoderma longibrachiatum ATCC 18648]|uniref:Uncharacterized protein n=1 Tax=Trichoderma longibrachiatum ATCC 18648 TaxID=983965 RepID=A0A2T4BY25_TRILO|nr:hypothetical protein M440DRAFT_109820 [Trichoderma longibrachiatum ATCC 18648]
MGILLETVKRMSLGWRRAWGGGSKRIGIWIIWDRLVGEYLLFASWLFILGGVVWMIWVDVI